MKIIGGRGGISYGYNLDERYSYGCTNGGAGGLLICYSNILKGEGTFSSVGAGNDVKTTVGAGSCGGGSINVFYNESEGNVKRIVNLEKLKLTTGTTLEWSYYFVIGGSDILANGGDGTATLGSIKTGRFLQDF